MAKYSIKFSCGHTHAVAITGSVAEQERKAQWYKDCGICPDCYTAKKAAEREAKYEVIEMHYGEYKRNYSDCKTVAGSYDSANKTIKVYVPRDKKENDEEAAKEHDEEVRLIANISRSELFKKAHAYTKKFLADTFKYTGVKYDYNVTFSALLKDMYVTIKACREQLAA